MVSWINESQHHFCEVKWCVWRHRYQQLWGHLVPWVWVDVGGGCDHCSSYEKDLRVISVVTRICHLLYPSSLSQLFLCIRFWLDKNPHMGFYFCLTVLKMRLQVMQVRLKVGSLRNCTIIAGQDSLWNTKTRLYFSRGVAVLTFCFIVAQIKLLWAYILVISKTRSLPDEETHYGRIFTDFKGKGTKMASTCFHISLNIS